MVVFCDAMILATLTLLSLVVAIFVLALSFLGRAIKQSEEQAARIIDEEEKEFDKTVQEAKTMLGERKTSEARRGLERYEKKKKQFEKKRVRASSEYRLLTVKGGILYPGVALLLSLAFVVTAKYLITVSGAVAEVFSYILLILAAVGIGWGCYRAYISLSVVQSVATIPEEVQLKRTIDAFETAMQRHDERIRPKLDFSFLNPLPPFEIKLLSEQVIEYQVFAEEGSSAKEVVVSFIAPDGLEFPGVKKTSRVVQDVLYPGAPDNNIELPDIKGGYYTYNTITIKAPEKIGTYKLVYVFGCEGFRSDFKELDVKVVE